MDIEQLTAENLELKEQLEQLQQQNQSLLTDKKGLEDTVIQLREHNAKLYAKIGTSAPITESEKSEAETKDEFINEYIKSKIGGK